jgi:hypothetical protein
MADRLTVDVVEARGPASVPDRLEDFLGALRGPTLFHVAGEDRSRTRVVAGSLHGNEPSGMRAIHRALREGIRPRTDVLYYIGGVEAAREEPRFSFRFLPGRRDPNRCFRPPWIGIDGRIARDVLRLIEERSGLLELAVDLHNNTGRNPAYAIVPTLEGPHLALSVLFTTRVIHSRLSQGTFDEAVGRWCPSVTIECGQTHDPAADATAWQGLLRLLNLDRLEPLVVHPESLEIFVAPIRVEIAPGLSIAFGDRPHSSAEVTIDGDVDRHNFETLEAGTRIGFVRPGTRWPLRALDEAGAERSHELFAVDVDGALVTRQAIVPIMMTTNPVIAVSDCLFYTVRRRR